MAHANSRSARGLLAAFILLLSVVAGGLAQGTGQIGRLTITDANTEGFPGIQLQLYGMDGTGAPLDFAAEPLFVSHNGFPVDEVIYDGSTQVGTLTVFLIDAAGGLTDQMPAIEAAIRQFAAPGNMQEQLDYVAIYQNRATGPAELLAPTPFHNGVANLFNTSPLAAEEGSTSLYDSVIDMLGRVEELKPRPEMAASLVLISDGTDPGTSQAQPADVISRATAVGVPVHTLHLENPALGAGVELGRVYMRDLATGSRGVAAELGDAAGLGAVWARIAGFRDHALIRYAVPEAVGGTVPVEVSLLNNRDVRDTTEVTISTAAPNVVINLARESRSLTLPDLDEPVELQLSTTVSWLDGQQREVTAAQLLVNGQPAADIPVNSLAGFTVPISNLIFGDNRLEVVATDSQGLTSTSAPVIITVTQGNEAVVPEELQPSGLGVGWLWPLLGVLALAALAAAGYWWWRNRGARRNQSGSAAPAGGSARRRRRGASSRPQPGYPAATGGVTIEDEFMGAGSPVESPFVMAHLEVLDAQTLMPEELTLGEMEVRVGRSPAQAQIAFRDDITVSRFHAVLRLEGTRYRIYDAGSTSGTFVNDQPVPDYGLQLADGDEIQLGAVRLRYRQL